MNNPRKNKSTRFFILDATRDFCNETSMHGFNHISAPRRHWLERLLWLTIISLAVWGAIDVSYGQWLRYDANPTVITLDKDFRHWSFPLPGITFCDVNKVDPKRQAEVIKSTWNVTPGDPKYDYYKSFVDAVANSDLFHLEQFENFTEDPMLEVDLFRLAVDVAPDFSARDVWVHGATPRWFPVMTEVGFCFMTNSLAMSDIVLRKVNINDTKNFPIECKFSDFSCFVILEMYNNITIYPHSPYDIADVTTVPFLMYLTLNRKSELSVIESRCGPGVKELEIRRRRCLYVDEPRDEKSKIYSSNMCRRSCRNHLAIKLCGCKPFYNFYEDGTPCTPAGMWCLSKYAMDLLSMKCKCMLQCNDATYQEMIFEEQLWDRGPFVYKTLVKYVVQPPKARYSREIVFHFQDLVVSFGGAAGLFLGASFLSFVEILYFVFERCLMLCFKPKKIQPLEVTGKEMKKPNINFEMQQVMYLEKLLER